MLQKIMHRSLMNLRLLGGARPRRVVLLHIPKCGGSTITAHFKFNYGSQRSGRTVLLDSVLGSARDADMIARARRALFVSGHFGWNTLEAVAGDALLLTVLREPFDRLVSLYLFARSIQTTHPGFGALTRVAKANDFSSFCLAQDDLVKSYICNAQTRTLASDYYPYSPTGLAGAVETAKKHVSRFDFILHLSELRARLTEIARRTQTLASRSRSHVNKTTASPDVFLPTQSEFMADPRLRTLLEADYELYAYAMEKRFAP